MNKFPFTCYTFAPLEIDKCMTFKNAHNKMNSADPLLFIAVTSFPAYIGKKELQPTDQSGHFYYQSFGIQFNKQMAYFEKNN